MCQFCVPMRYTVKQLTSKKLLEKSLSFGTDKTIGDRRISLQAALTAVPPFCPTGTGISWKLYIYIYISVCVCVCVYEGEWIVYEYQYYNIVLKVYLYNDVSLRILN